MKKIEIINDKIFYDDVKTIFENMKHELNRIEGNGHLEIDGTYNCMWEIKDFSLFTVFRNMINNSINELNIKSKL